MLRNQAVEPQRRPKMLNLLAFALLSQAGQVPGTLCPVGGHEADQAGPKYFYKGVVYFICCEGCGPSLVAEPDKFLKGRQSKDLIGYSIFDVVAMKSVDPKKAPAYSDYNGVRYYFLTEENKQIFDKDPRKAHDAPEYEAAEVCAVRGEPVDLNKPTKYADYNGVRYYFCCAGCASSFAKDAASSAKTVTPKKAAVHVLPAK